VSGGGSKPLSEARESVTAAAGLLTVPGVIFLSAVLVLAIWYRLTAVLLLAALFVSMAGLSALWSRLCLVGVRAERHWNGTRRFPGEPFECRLRVINRKPLPLPWVEVESALPPGSGDEATPWQTAPIRRSTALLWYRSVTWTVRFACRRRGFYPLPPLALASSDLLGLYPRRRSVGPAEALIVYPRLFPVDTRLIPSLHPMGEFAAAQLLFRDPTHTIGVRAYERRDSLRLIHWKATARRGDLQVRVPAATTTFSAALFLDVGSFAADGSVPEEDFELAVSIAGSIAAALAERGNPVGLFANTRLADTGEPAAIHPSAVKGRLTGLLEALAKVTRQRSRPFDAFVEDQKRFLPAGTTVVLLVGRPAASLPALLAGLAHAAFKRLVLVVGEGEMPILPDRTPWRRIRSAGDLAPKSCG
jgi:uncharacterized protein (DUF58 family)